MLDPILVFSKTKQEQEYIHIRLERLGFKDEGRIEHSAHGWGTIFKSGKLEIEVYDWDA